MNDAPGVHRAGWSALDPGTLHDLLKLRVDVFVVEQECPYPELDGRDVEPGTGHWWTADAGGAPTAYLRTLAEPDGTTRVGRVCTRADARGQGLAGELMRAVLAEAGTGPVVLEAQSYLEKWYSAFGFEVTGPEYVEDGIPHVPMRRPPSR
ncbi:GNAT family N-acetyltransferase [Spongisporangium articulatum]|uniref:GNAT family N-acetyltransferase n=1 Tax=Spongisporangium articulatum TaxID=3362603 RepID=A0ABW8ASX8_9ACTN